MKIPSFARRFAPVAFLASALALAGCSSSTTSSTTPPTPMTNDVDIVFGAQSLTNTAFNPDTKTVALAGGSSVAVRFVNNDSDPSNYGSTGTTHHIVSDDGTTFDAGTLAPGHTMTVSFSAHRNDPVPLRDPSEYGGVDRRNALRSVARALRSCGAAGLRPRHFVFMRRFRDSHGRC